MNEYITSILAVIIFIAMYVAFLRNNKSGIMFFGFWVIIILLSQIIMQAKEILLKLH